MQTKLLINGQLVAGEGAAQAVLNPSLGTTLVEINEASSSQVDAAVQAADAAFDSWSQTVPKDRAQLLLRLADAIDANAESLARLESNNCGKPRKRSKTRCPRSSRWTRSTASSKQQGRAVIWTAYSRTQRRVVAYHIGDKGVSSALGV